MFYVKIQLKILNFVISKFINLEMGFKQSIYL
jgi:hypothetical protein